MDDTEYSVKDLIVLLEGRMETTQNLLVAVLGLHSLMLDLSVKSGSIQAGELAKALNDLAEQYRDNEIGLTAIKGLAAKYSANLAE